MDCPDKKARSEVRTRVGGSEGLAPVVGSMCQLRCPGSPGMRGAVDEGGCRGPGIPDSLKGPSNGLGSHEGSRDQRQPPAHGEHQQRPERGAGHVREERGGDGDRPHLRLPPHQLQRLPHMRDPRGRQVLRRGRRVQRHPGHDESGRCHPHRVPHVHERLSQQPPELSGEGDARVPELRPAAQGQGRRRDHGVPSRRRFIGVQPARGLPAEERHARRGDQPSPDNQGLALPPVRGGRAGHEGRPLPRGRDDGRHGASRRPAIRRRRTRSPPSRRFSRPPPSSPRGRSSA